MSHQTDRRDDQALSCIGVAIWGFFLVVVLICAVAVVIEAHRLKLF